MINFENSNLVLLLSGVCLFLYGLNLISTSLERMMAHKISELLNRLGNNQFLSILVGISLTSIMQSSGAVISMLVGLGSARVITLQQVMGVIIGTAIGTTLTVQLISFHLYSLSLPFFIVGFLTYFRGRHSIVKNFATTLMGFGLLFMGQRFISTGSEALIHNPLLTEFFATLKENSMYSLIAAIALSTLVQSSAMTIGIAMSLAQINAINIHDAILWVYGANIGTTSTAILAASSANYIGKQVAWAHFFYKTASVILFYPLTAPFVSVITYAQVEISRVIANSHLLFNILSSVIFYPFIKIGSEFIEKIFPPQKEDQFGVEFVGLNSYSSPALATSYANREILRTADLVVGMITDSIKMFESNSSEIIESIKERDNKVDFLYREVKMYLLDRNNKDGAQVQQNIMEMIMFLSDLERAADAIDINLVTLANKKNALRLEFSEEGWREIKMMHAFVCKSTALAVNAFQNIELCADAIQLKRDLAKMETKLREKHIERLNRGNPSSIKTSSIHLDLLSEYRRISSLLCNHAYNKTKKPA